MISGIGLKRQDSNIRSDYVFIKESTLSTSDNKFEGAFAGTDFQKGEIIESGVMKVLGNASANDTNQFGSNHATLYQNNPQKANTKLIRDVESNTFTIVATRDIKKNEELFSLISYKLMLF